MKKLSPVYELREAGRARILGGGGGGEFWRQIRETKQIWRKHKVETFASIDHYSFDNSYG